MKTEDKNNLSSRIKEKAADLGFDLCGIAKARPLKENEPVLKAWCEAGMNSNMGYLGRNIEKRLNPEFLLPGAKSIVVTGLNYFSEIRQPEPGVPVISRYAYGINYHDVITVRLEKLLAFIKTIESGTEGRSFVDSAPLLEKAWAKEAGLGWRGKHSIIINKKIGSFYFIGILILNIDLGYDVPFTGDYCGECQLCIDLCPTGAINDNRTVDARKCIANLTIENRGPIPEEIIPMMEGRVYGCDKCQEVCPWNKKVQPNHTPEFAINPGISAMSPEDWLSITREQYARLFKNSAIGRVKYEQLMQNIRLIMNSEKKN
ncbi:MAG: tRNA epoxyqueuosine(34) reductase QueG [Bacteroidales bacterium]|nr:tRNA epoxyqueuosine(34) reductase QueG [Bacteroidales bacterium]